MAMMSRHQKVSLQRRQSALGVVAKAVCVTLSLIVMRENIHKRYYIHSFFHLLVVVMVFSTHLGTQQIEYDIGEEVHR